MTNALFCTSCYSLALYQLLDGQRTRLITDPLGRSVFSVWHLSLQTCQPTGTGSAILTSTNAAHSYICAYNIYHFPYSSLLVSVFWDRLITKVKLVTYNSKGIKPVNTFFFFNSPRSFCIFCYFYTPSICHYSAGITPNKPLGVSNLTASLKFYSIIYF